VERLGEAVLGLDAKERTILPRFLTEKGGEMTGPEEPFVYKVRELVQDVGAQLIDARIALLISGGDVDLARRELVAEDLTGLSALCQPTSPPNER
jgi:hypothetical protein